MKEIKDNFSNHSSGYANFRPAPPDDLLNVIYQHVSAFNIAWDCGTGNGQAAVKLAAHFKTIYATDISDKQLELAEKRSNITYKNERAEQTALITNSVDLITVAQAIHWFDIPAFYNEVMRVAKQDAVIAVWTYILLRVSPEINKIIDHLYYDIIYKYWDKERKLVDAEYTTIPFPFQEIKVPSFQIIQLWNRDQFIGYLNTWSGLQHFIKKENRNPIDIIRENIFKAWAADEVKEVHFPLRIRLGKIK